MKRLEFFLFCRWPKGPCSIPLITSILLTVAPARATTVIFYSNGNEIFTASDGKMLNVGSLAQGLPPKGPKIFRLGDVVVGFAGIRSDAGSGFDCIRIAEKALANQTPLTNAIQQIEETCSNGLYQIFTTPNAAQKLAATTNVARRLEMGFATFRSGIPEICSIGFEITTKSNSNCAIRVARNGIIADKPCVVCLGVRNEINAYVDRYPSFFQHLGAEKGVQMLVKKEIEAQPGSVGYPIFGFHIQRSGIAQLHTIEEP